MANPKKKHTRMRRGMRRSSNWRLEALHPSVCNHCGSQTLPHQVCPDCGYYGGELVLPRKVKTKKEEGGESQQP